MYDVCLSFAGEQREYVDQVAQALRAYGVRVFYDKFEAVNLWGKDLYQHLQEVYSHHARFCVVFISEAYAAKPWTRHELKSAQARAFAEDAEYLLPARFDDTEIPGIPGTVGYIDLRGMLPEVFASLIVRKLGRTTTLPEAQRSKPAVPSESRSAELHEQRSTIIPNIRPQESHQLPLEAVANLPRQPRLTEIESEPQPKVELLVGLTLGSRGRLYTSPMTPEIDCTRCGRKISATEAMVSFGDGYAHWLDCLDDG